jgi:uncharacterized protein YkwD
VPLRRPSVPAYLPAVLAVVLSVGAGISPALVAPAAARDGSTFVNIVNRYRADAGVSPVSLHAKIDQISVERADQLARARKLGHDFDYVIARLEQLGVCWRALGEIVAWNTVSDAQRLERFGTQWYNSDPHRAIMLGSGYTHAGGSWKTGSDGRHYAAMVFVKLCGATAAPVTRTAYTDIADSPFRSDIVWVVDRGIMKGCSSTQFCPTSVVSRAPMATYLRRAMGLRAPTRDWFGDDNTSAHEDNINRLAEAGITRGCGYRRFCPKEDVTRAELAAFFARALRLPATSRDYFRDDDGMKLEDSINRLAAAGLTRGCAQDKFCPRARVTKEQLAAFIRRAWD